MLWSAAGKIGFGALGSFWGASAGNAQRYYQQADSYRNASIQFQQLGSQLEQQGKYNEEVIKSQQFNNSYVIFNKGMIELQDSYARDAATRAKVDYRTGGQVAQGQVGVAAAAVGAVGASTDAIQKDINKKIEQGVSDISRQRANDVYTRDAQIYQMYLDVDQNMTKIDESKINEYSMPDLNRIQGSAGKTTMMPHFLNAVYATSMDYYGLRRDMQKQKYGSQSGGGLSGLISNVFNL